FGMFAGRYVARRKGRPFGGFASWLSAGLLIEGYFRRDVTEATLPRAARRRVDQMTRCPRR
ncbi:MAG: hypothetical protein ACREME_10325, partial [Gemmatimonadales bacterium]